MAVREGTRASKEFMCVSLVPDFCKSPNIVVPYSIVSKFDCAVNFSTNVRFRKQWVFRHNSRLSTVLGDEAGAGGGVLSGVNKGFCRPIDGTSSKTVRANKSFVDYHEGTYMFMNCAGPDGQFNTIGRVIFLGNMLPGPVAPGAKVPKGCIEGSSSLLADIESQFGDLNDLIGKAKQLYALAQTDWSNPAAVLGAMGGLAGIAGLQDVAELAKKGKELYELGKQVVNTDWSDPMQALAALAGVANVAGMKDVAKVAGMANTIGNAIKTDWSDPRAALASATAIMKNAGLNQMAEEMASNAILDSDIPVSQSGTAPPLFPKPGSAGKDAGPPIPPSSENKPRVPITPDAYAELQRTNPIAAARYDSLSSDDKNRAFVEYPKDSRDPSRAAVYVPGEGFSSTQAERDSLPNVSQHVPSGIREVFVASHDDATKGNVFGIKEKEGNVYLFGGLVDLGSPDMPGAGTSTFWWVPDRILNMDMSPYYDYHDRNYYGDNVTLGDVGKILDHEMAAFKAGANGNPLQLPLQMLYSTATTGVGLGTAAFNSVNQAILGSSGDQKSAAPGGLQIDSFSSIGDFFSSAFDSGGIDPKSMADFFGPGGCMPDSAPTLPGQTVPGGPSGPGAGTKPATGKAGAPEGAASGAGKDGVLITTKQGNPAAAAAALEAKARAANKKALEKAQAEERAKQEQAAKAKTQQNSSQPASVGKDESSSGDDVDLSGEGPMCKPSDAIVVGIGGTASGGPNTDDGHVEKLVRDYATDDDKKLFLDGPDQMLPIGTGVAGSMQQLENQAYDFIVRQHELRPDIPIDIYGHSRGAYGGLQLSARLGDAGIPVRNLGLYDPVDMALGYGGQESIPANVAHATVVRARDDDDGGPDQSREVFRRPPVLPNDPSATDYREYDSTGSHAAIGGNPGTAPLDDSGGHFSGPDAEANELAESRRSDEAVRTGARESGAQIKPREDYDTIGQDRRRDEESRRNMVPPKPGPIPG